MVLMIQCVQVTVDTKIIKKSEVQNVYGIDCLYYLAAKLMRLFIPRCLLLRFKFDNIVILK